MNICPELLAQVPQSFVYINPIKLGAVVLVFALWTLIAQWVDKDTVAVNTFRVLWNLIALAAGTVALLLALFVPVFWIGFASMVVIDLTVAIVYVIHRNGLVKDDDKVMTIGHFKRLKEQGLSGKKKEKEVTEKVRLTGADRKVVAIPEDDVEKDQYALTQDLMFDALWRRAAIIELVPGGPQLSKVTYLVDGMPVEGEKMDRQDGESLLLYIKQMAGLNLEERRKPQKGEIMAAIGDNKHRVLVRTDGSTAGEKLNMRIIYDESNYKCPDLGFTEKQLESVQATKETTKGVIVLSAPSKNGLTTTIYSFTRNHDRFLQNVQMIEYEKELDVDNVTQTVFDPTEGKSFAERLLKIVRSDPDIIVLPEVREREAAVIACKAASEKQKVYVALQANDLFDGLGKWVRMVGDKKLVARSLLAICNQRLVRVLCSECKQAYKPDPQMMRKLNLPADKVLYRPPEPEFDKRGNQIVCQACQGTGYSGRTGVYDWLVIDDGLRDVIQRSTSMSEIQSYAVKKGGLGLQAQALQKVLDGVTSIQEVARTVRGEGTPRGGKPTGGQRPARGAGGRPPRPQPKPRPQTGQGGAPTTGGR